MRSGIKCFSTVVAGMRAAQRECYASSQPKWFAPHTIREQNVRRHRSWKHSSIMLSAAVFFIMVTILGNDSAEASVDNGSHVHHEINYIEIEVTDMDKSKLFYATAFDWEFNDYGPTYAGIRKLQGGEAGGLRLQPEVDTGGPLVILYSENLEATLGRVRDAGWDITQEPFEFPGGRRFHFRDPSGNELAVWSDK